ncbi:unnamed protein product [Nippostrongylus brasiliensis]|uniref:PPIP5K2_N domain-containing protein n=1 Tax=Nippostrongylus brasiliensis TaxID=27835 RepID=A0A0N4XPT3_NIPBR|nr:unnamed protein product [Nippostrongylus brasiliensis]
MRGCQGDVCGPDWLEYFIFPESVIIHEEVDRWPLCDCLISFHSTDFPLHKAIEYVKLRKPYVINDLKRQYDLLDRRKVFRTLAKEGIEHPRHGVLMRSDSHEEGWSPNLVLITGNCSFMVKLNLGTTKKN